MKGIFDWPSSNIWSGDHKIKNGLVFKIKRVHGFDNSRHLSRKWLGSKVKRVAWAPCYQSIFKLTSELWKSSLALCCEPKLMNWLFRCVQSLTEWSRNVYFQYHLSGPRGARSRMERSFDGISFLLIASLMVPSWNMQFLSLHDTSFPSFCNLFV